MVASLSISGWGTEEPSGMRGVSLVLFLDFIIMLKNKFG